MFLSGVICLYVLPVGVDCLDRPETGTVEVSRRFARTMGVRGRAVHRTAPTAIGDNRAIGVQPDDPQRRRGAAALRPSAQENLPGAVTCLRFRLQVHTESHDHQGKGTHAKQTQQESLSGFF